MLRAIICLLERAAKKGERAMTETPAGGGRAEMERRVIQRSLQDENFRQQLIADPKATMEQELGVRLPAGVQVQAVEETADTIYLVLPSVSPLVGEGGEIPDQELETVAGGSDTYTWSELTCSGALCPNK
jgi:hypothetical protein